MAAFSEWVFNLHRVALCVLCGSSSWFIRRGRGHLVDDRRHFDRLFCVLWRKKSIVLTQLLYLFCFDPLIYCPKWTFPCTFTSLLGWSFHLWTILNMIFHCSQQQKHRFIQVVSFLCDLNWSEEFFFQFQCKFFQNGRW